MIITLKQLKRVGACEGEVARFEKLYGARVRITKKLCLKHALGVDWDWAARHLLKNDAWKVYWAAERSALKDYLAAERPAWKVYQAAIQPARDVYRTATQAALEVYYAGTQPAWKVYLAAKALAFHKATLIK